MKPLAFVWHVSLPLQAVMESRFVAEEEGEGVGGWMGWIGGDVGGWGWMGSITHGY